MSHRRPSELTAAALGLLAACVGLLAACGVGTSGDAHRSEPADVPFDLLDDRSSGETTGRSSDTTAVDLYFYDGRTERLLPVASEVEDTALEAVLRRLQDVSGSTGVPAGNPLSDAEVIRSVDTARGRATVDLDESFSDLSGTDQLIALAEIVYTATGRPGIGQVTFTLDGKPVEVTRADGSLTSDPLARSDYLELAPAP